MGLTEIKRRVRRLAVDVAYLAGSVEALHRRSVQSPYGVVPWWLFEAPRRHVRLVAAMLLVGRDGFVPEGRYGELREKLGLRERSFDDLLREVVASGAVLLDERGVAVSPHILTGVPVVGGKGVDGGGGRRHHRAR